MSLRRLIALLAVAVPLAFAASAHAYVYWGDYQGGTIGRANLDGTAVEDGFIHTGGEPRAVAVDGSHIYWANYAGGTIGRANIDGSEVQPNFITGIGKPAGVAVTSSYIFWTSVTGNEIGRAALNGGERNPELIKSVLAPCGIAVDSGSVYWAGISGAEGVIGRAPFTGISPKYEFVKETGAATMCGLAVNSANIFWTNTGFFVNSGTEIGRANTTDGQGQNPSLIGTAEGPCGIAILGTQLYWANSTAGTIGRANTDGTAVNETFLRTGAKEICGIAVDSLASPPIPPPTTDPGTGPGGGDGSGQSSPPPSQPPTPGALSWIKAKDDKKHGTARVTVQVNEAGVVSIAGKGILATKTQAPGAGQVTVSIKAAKQKRLTLKRVGKLTTKVTISLTPSDNGAPATVVKSVTLRLTKKPKT